MPLWILASCYKGTLPNLLVLLVIAAGCYGYPNFQQKIPNGEMVPHPCKANFIWREVGHENHLGGGHRNAFGVDFKTNHEVWNAALCNKDSDGDGKTNGEELGDPDCTWTPGAEPKRRAGLSHPGICDPFDNPLCSGKPDFVDCSKLEFKCDAINEPEVFNFTVRLKETAVPPEETVYQCMLFDFSSFGGEEHHIVAYTPYIDTDIVHHILIYGCTGNVSRPLDEPYDCNMQTGESTCTDIIGAWRVGMSGYCIHPNVGMLIGGATGYKAAAIEFRFDVKLRPNNGGAMLVGQSHLQLPPGREGISVHGRCEGSCTKQMLSGDINVIAAGNHMHYLGVAQTTTLRRNGKTVANIAIDRTFSYDSPVLYDHREPIVVKPGDDIETTCVYRTTSRTKTVFNGLSTSDEMCLVVIQYYPKENAQFKYCYSWKNIGDCERYSDQKSKDGCDLATMYDLSNPMIVNITQKCYPFVCVEECKDYIRELRQTNPCFTGQNYEYLQAIFGKKAMPIFTKAASCDVQLALEQNGETSKSTATITATIPFSALMVMIFAICIM